MHIAICEDEKPQRELIEKYVNEWAAQKKIKVRIALFENSEQFFFYWSEERDVDVILLDIEMGAVNGMALAREIRKKDEKLQIIFVTGVKEYIAEGYEVDALNYLIKPLKKEKLFGCLDKVVDKEKQVGSKILVDTNEGLISILSEKIWYLEAIGHHCMVGLEKKEYEAKANISTFMQHAALSGQEYIKCHRSYVVNLTFVSKLEKSQLILDDGRSIPISRGAYKKVMQAFISFYSKNK